MHLIDMRTGFPEIDHAENMNGCPRKRSRLVQSSAVPRRLRSPQAPLSQYCVVMISRSKVPPSTPVCGLLLENVKCSYLADESDCLDDSEVEVMRVWLATQIGRHEGPTIFSMMCGY